MDIRETVAPPPGGNTFPTMISSTSSGFNLTRSTQAFKAAAKSSSWCVSLKPPRLARVMGVRTAETMTMSSADLTPGLQTVHVIE